MLSHVKECGLLHVHAAQRAVVAEAEQVRGVSGGERHAGDGARVRLEEEDAIVAPVCVLQAERKWFGLEFYCIFFFATFHTADTKDI